MNLSSSFLQFVAQRLPNLVALQLTILTSGGTEIIEFPNVQLLIGINIAAENLRLPKLQLFQIRFNDMNRESCIKFMHNHPNINGFQLASGSELDNQIFAEIASNLPNVIEMTIDDGNRIAPQNIVNFLENHSKIQNLSLGYCVASAKKILTEKLNDKWNFSIYKNCLSFSRKP